MLANGIKNAILLLLVILILHFLIKNITASNPSNSLNTSNSATNIATNIPISNSINSNSKEHFLAYPQDSTSENTSCKNSMTTEKNKMMEYVNSDYSKQFDQKLITECTKPNLCLNKTDDHKLPLSTTCDANITELNGAPHMNVKEDCNLTQDHHSFMMIKTYENENPNNGGALYDGLEAYDDFDDYYESYNSKCSMNQQTNSQLAS
jgi:hypothetical protein